MKKTVLIFVGTVFYLFAAAQADRWQQRIMYAIDVKLDVDKNQLSGVEKIEYFNNSPDTLTKIYLFTFWNAFQPGSNMDINSLLHGNMNVMRVKDDSLVRDWDARIKDRIHNLKPDEIGFQKINFIKNNGKDVRTIEHETIVEVLLDKPILPRSISKFEVGFNAQVPIQIRRSGRDNKEGVRYSISQWYPKMAEYDYKGWNINPYIAREFYGIWGDFDVRITVDSSYKIAATGMLNLPKQTAGKLPILSATKTWNYVGKNVHDFVWAADPNYIHLYKKIRSNLTIHAYYKSKDASTDSAWNNVLWAAEKVLPFIEKKFGKYPWPQYSFIQGGDGGMEYAMASLVKAPGLGTAFHEWMHSWYQQLLGSNEFLYPWMDEGFTDFAKAQVMDYYLNNWANQSPFINELTKAENAKNLANNQKKKPLIYFDSYKSYFKLVKNGLAEPMSTPADFYSTNIGYSINSYSKGTIFLSQLGYIVGEKMRDDILIAYYNQWQFKHPNANDFVRVAEKSSGFKLDWYHDFWINTTKTIDYAVDSLWEEDGKTKVRIKRIGEMPMPLDIQLTFKDGSKELHYVPIDIMYNQKPNEDTSAKWIVYHECKWNSTTIVIESSRKLFDISQVEIDPTQRMADVDTRNNLLKIKW